MIIPRPVYLKTFGRNFALGELQIWYWAEANERQWISKKLPFYPYIVFHRQEEKTDVYYDPVGIKWLKDEILEQTKKDMNFSRSIAEEYRSQIEKMIEIFKTEPALSLDELKEFAENNRDAYSWFEGLWWSIEAFENLPEYKKELDFLMEVRKETEIVVPARNSIIRKSIARAYPDLSIFADVILLEEAYENKLPSKEHLINRKKEYYYTDNQLFLASARVEIQEKYNISLEDINDSAPTNEIRGKIAYKGKVRGRVRKIFSPDQMVDFQEGEILVAFTTTPDLIPAIKKSAGMIGDDGGIISHTAIAAREFKKPCIIGTKIATKVLKDGDLVEVDADNGIVRRLD